MTHRKKNCASLKKYRHSKKKNKTIKGCPPKNIDPEYCNFQGSSKKPQKAEKRQTTSICNNNQIINCLYRVFKSS